MKKKVNFHGGCLPCTEQKDKGLAYCVGCCYFEADWSLPNLSKDNSWEKVQKEFALEMEEEKRHKERVRKFAKLLAYLKIKI